MSDIFIFLIAFVVWNFLFYWFWNWDGREEFCKRIPYFKMYEKYRAHWHWVAYNKKSKKKYLEWKAYVEEGKKIEEYLKVLDEEHVPEKKKKGPWG